MVLRIAAVLGVLTFSGCGAFDSIFDPTWRPEWYRETEVACNQMYGRDMYLFSQCMAPVEHRYRQYQASTQAFFESQSDMFERQSDMYGEMRAAREAQQQYVAPQYAPVQQPITCFTQELFGQWQTICR